MVLFSDSIVKFFPSPCISRLIDQTVQAQEKHEALACYHLDQAHRAQSIRAALEDLIPTPGTAAVGEVAHG